MLARTLYGWLKAFLRPKVLHARKLDLLAIAMYCLVACRRVYGG